MSAQVVRGGAWSGEACPGQVCQGWVRRGDVLSGLVGVIFSAEDVLEFVQKQSA